MACGVSFEDLLATYIAEMQNSMSIGHNSQSQVSIQINPCFTNILRWNSEIMDISNYKSILTSRMTRYMPVRCNGRYLYTDMSLFSDAIKNQLNNNNK
jgi:hypothetical protein